jgi:hypothetical protein
MKYQFIAEHRREYPITLMCRTLEVSVSGDSAWCQRTPSEHSREDAQRSFESEGGLPSQSPRVWQSTCACRTAGTGYSLCSQTGGASDARNLRLFAHRPRHRTITTKSEKGAQVAPNEAIARRESPIGPTPNGWLIPPPFGQQKVGCTLRWYLMCSRGWW